MGKGCQAALDHVITWNYYLPPQITKPNPKSHKKFDHNQIWTQLPHLDLPKLANPARTTPPGFSQRIDTIFFKRHVDDWKARMKTQIQGDLVENPTGQALADERGRERDCSYYIIIQTYEVGLHSRRHPIEINAGTRPFASFDAPIS